MNFDSSIVLFISAIAGLLGMPIVQGFKQWFKVDGKVALLIATGVSLVLAFVSLFLSGQFVGVEISLASLVEASGVVFSVATLFYKALLGDK